MNNNIKVITLCGSMKFQKEMMITAEKLALEGNCVLTPVYSVLDNYEKTDEKNGNRFTGSSDDIRTCRLRCKKG